MLDIKPPDYKHCPFCGKPLEEIKTDRTKRKYCPKDDWVYYPKVAISSVAVIRNKNKVLMVKRARKPYMGTWMFPAGFVEYAEHPSETLIREVKEEVGLDIKTFKLWKVQQVEDDPREPGHLAFVYKAYTSSKSIKNLDRDENQQAAWVDITDPPKIGWKQHKQIMKILQEEKL